MFWTGAVPIKEEESRITVKTAYGEILEEVKPSDNLRNVEGLCAHLANLLCINKSNVTVECEKLPTINNHTVLDVNQEFVIKLKTDQMFWIIRGTDGGSRFVSENGVVTIKDIKCYIENEYKIPVDRQILYYKNVIIGDDFIEKGLAGIDGPIIIVHFREKCEFPEVSEFMENPKYREDGRRKRPLHDQSNHDHRDLPVESTSPFHGVCGQCYKAICSTTGTYRTIGVTHPFVSVSHNLEDDESITTCHNYISHKDCVNNVFCALCRTQYCPFAEVKVDGNVQNIYSTHKFNDRGICILLWCSKMFMRIQNQS